MANDQISSGEDKIMDLPSIYHPFYQKCHDYILKSKSQTLLQP